MPRENVHAGALLRSHQLRAAIQEQAFLLLIFPYAAPSEAFGNLT